MIGVEEDKLCKPDRPFSSGRISLESGQTLYLLVLVLCVGASIYNRLTAVSVIYILAMWLYNDIGLSANPAFKTILCTIGYTCYCWGTTFIVGMLVIIALTVASFGLIQYYYI